MDKNTFLKFSSILIIVIAIFLISLNFLFWSDKNVSAQKEEELVQELTEKCLVEAEIRNGFEAGKIPVGELVDYSEFFGKEVLKNLNTIVSNTEAAIKNADKLTDLSKEFICKNCEIKCEEDEEGNETCWCDNFDKLMAKAYGYVSAIKHNLGEIVAADANIYDLANAEGTLVEENPPLNRWKLILTLTDSRNKLESCLMGYARVLKSKRVTATLLSCMVALDRINLADILVVPGFNKFASNPEELCFEELVPDPNRVCYPYNSVYWLETNEVDECKQNKDGQECHQSVKDLMHNFFCCIGGN